MNTKVAHLQRDLGLLHGLESALMDSPHGTCCEVVATTVASRFHVYLHSKCVALMTFSGSTSALASETLVVCLHGAE